MIIETAHVLRVSGSVAWVRCDGHAGCQRCAQGQGCGGGVMGRLLGERLREVTVDAGGFRLASGDRVRIGLSETALLKSSLVMYLLPLLTMLGAALIADRLAPAAWQELASVAAALPGLWAGLALARAFGRRRTGFAPRVVGLEAGAGTREALLPAAAARG
jgi:sigma-E factor negative regulatory protein RseC